MLRTAPARAMRATRPAVAPRARLITGKAEIEEASATAARARVGWAASDVDRRGERFADPREERVRERKDMWEGEVRARTVF